MTRDDRAVDAAIDALLAEPPPHVVASRRAEAGQNVGWKVTVTSDSAELSTQETGEKLIAASDWDGVLRHFGLNPLEFSILDDSVRMSSWQQSKRLDSGERDTVTLYSYRARFTRRTGHLAPADVDSALRMVQAWRPAARRTEVVRTEAPSTFYMGWADWQLGKEGTVATVEQRVLDSFQMAVDRIKELRRAGRNVQRLAVWNMGDPTEGCSENYASQTFTVELTRREQLNLALRLWLVGLRALAPLFDDVEFGSVLCNHGEWTRTGGKAITSDSDNIGGYLGDTLQTVLAGRPGFDHVTYRIPQSEMTMMTSMSGVPVALTHGHKMPGSNAERQWLLAQSLRMLREHGAEPRLWMTAHRHHLDIKDYGQWHRIQHPSLDMGSKWFADTSGQWSSPGAFTCLVGEHSQAGGPLNGMGRGFSDEMVLIPTA